jgi:enoyl-CoA hydratase/carnithine racemase
MSEHPQPVLIVEKKDDLLILTLNRSDNANALNPELVEALLHEIDKAVDIRLCVIRGNGRHFCAGFDLSDIEQCSDGDVLWRILRIELMLQAIHHAPFPIVALAHNQVVGAGADLFAACWLRVAAPDIKLKMPGWNFELSLGTRRLAKLTGAQAARDLLIDTKTLNAQQSLGINLATDIVEPDQWDQLITETLERTRVLPLKALRDMLSLTATDTREQDLATIVHTAGRAGLKQRILAYRAKVIKTAKNKKALK